MLLLKGDTIKLPAPKKVYAEDVVIHSDVAIFATSKLPITNRSPYNTSDQQEDVMMASRWKMFSVHHQFTEGEQKDIAACVRCFAKLLLQGKEAQSIKYCLSKTISSLQSTLNELPTSYQHGTVHVTAHLIGF